MRAVVVEDSALLRDGLTRILEAHGYGRVRRYAGGLEEWARIGYPLTGEGTV